jgi:hypothetical protein
MRKLLAVKLRVALYLVPVAITCLSIGFVIGENMAPKMLSCTVTITPGIENYGKPLPRAEKNNWY